MGGEPEHVFQKAGDVLGKKGEAGPVRGETQLGAAVGVGALQGEEIEIAGLLMLRRREVMTGAREQALWRAQKPRSASKTRSIPRGEAVCSTSLAVHSRIAV